MKNHQSFIFDSYSFDEKTGTITLNYSLDDEVKFTETLTIPVPTDSTFNIQSSTFQSALQALHLIGGISYYKTCLPKKIIIKSGSLTKDQTQFWNTVYENGLGEFFYRNNIDCRGFFNFPFEKETKNQKPVTKNPNPIPQPLTLVPLGGGKDSIVTLELLKQAGADITLFRMEPHPLIDELADIAKLPMITVSRKLDPLLFELNKQGALNGHIPISAYVSFVTVIVSLMHGFDAVAMSNERSASYGNVEFHGKEINHQWSKGLEFEKMFQAYVQTYVSENITCFSVLRPISELHIARLFSKYPQYFEHVTSCNANWKILDTAAGLRPAATAKWCGQCPKCAFVFAILSAFLPKDQLLKIFGKNLFEDESLIPLYKELLGLEGFKPFECVGTPEETVSAMILAHEKGEFNDTVIMKMATEEANLPENVHDMIFDQMTPSQDHAIPDFFASKLHF